MFRKPTRRPSYCLCLCRLSMDYSGSGSRWQGFFLPLEGHISRWYISGTANWVIIFFCLSTNWGSKVCEVHVPFCEGLKHQHHPKGGPQTRQIFRQLIVTNIPPVGQSPQKVVKSKGIRAPKWPKHLGV